MTVAVPHRILHCILGLFLTGHPIMKLLRRMHTKKKRQCGEDRIEHKCKTFELHSIPHL